MEIKYQNILNELVQKFDNKHEKYNIELFKKAYNFAYNAHSDQIRKSGQPYFIHPLEVSRILINYQLDIFTICGGLLHDVPEDTDITIKEVQEVFGKEIALLVDGVTKISGLHFVSFESKQAANLRKVILSMIKDIRVILIKFADRLHNMRTIDHLSVSKRKRIAIETRDVYAPLARRLGINRISTELEDHVLRILDNVSFNLIATKIRADQNKRKHSVTAVSETLTTELKKSKIRPIKIYDSSKNYYNTYIKMKKWKLPFDEISDNFSVKIILREVEECYFVLGIVHKLFTPVHDRFKDFIATPKSNQYQSLHTSVIGPDGNMMEIQIKTEYMDKIAEDGIAVSWLDKYGRINIKQIEKQFIWLHSISEWQNDTKDSGDFVENIKSDISRDEVFVFTPKGDLHRLRRGATPVDFAFSIHTNIGYHCIGAKINRNVVPLNFKLKSGDIIEIIVSNAPQPCVEWMQFVVTAKARSKIAYWLKNVRIDQQPDNSVKVKWDIDNDKQLISRLKILANNDQYLLKNIIELFTKIDLNIINMIFNTDNSLIRNTIDVKVKNPKQLKNLMNNILSIKGVISVERINDESI